MNRIAEFVKIQGKAAHLSREKFAELSGLGVRFIRKLESGKDGRKIERCYFKKEDLEKVKDLIKEKSPLER